MDNETLQKLQAVETEILKVVDEFCKAHGIVYSLYGGTMLGAVRHGGFIPWDDDIDICMDRNEYERFLRLWRENPVDGYSIAGDDGAGCPINHTKVLKQGTVLSSKSDMDKPIPHEIWLDVFAMDKIPTDAKLRKKLLRAAKLRLVYTRDHPYTNGGIIMNIASRLLLAKTKKRKQKLKEKYTRTVTQYKDMTDGFMYADLSCPRTVSRQYPADMFETESIDFDGVSALISSKSDEVLTLCYGDYMQLPPECDRVCRHNPEFLDFGDGNGLS